MRDFELQTDGEREAPVVSVLMPVCNAERFLKEAIDSVLSQIGLTNFELIIADDASTDNSRALLERYRSQDQRVRLLFNERRLGEAATRNRLISAASQTAKYIATMDADDICEPDRIAKQFEYLERNPEIGLLGSQISIIDEESRVIGRRTYLTSPAKVSKRRYIANPFAHPTVMIRANILREFGFYDGSRQRICDYELWMRLLEKTSGTNLSDTLLRYRISSSQAKSSRTRAIIKATLKLKLEHFNRNQWMNPQALLRLMGEAILLVLPPTLILKLFYIHLSLEIERSNKQKSTV